MGARTRRLSCNARRMWKKKEFLQIASRFMECLHQDTFPEMDDLHLFGIGGEYRPRSPPVLWSVCIRTLSQRWTICICSVSVVNIVRDRLPFYGVFASGHFPRDGRSASVRYRW